MSLCLFNLSGAASNSRSAGMVLQAVSHPIKSSGTQQPYEVRSLHLPMKKLSHRSATPQKPLRADEPVKQNGELDPSRVRTSACGSRRHWRRICSSAESSIACFVRTSRDAFTVGCPSSGFFPWADCSLPIGTCRILHIFPCDTCFCNYSTPGPRTPSSASPGNGLAQFCTSFLATWRAILWRGMWIERTTHA